MENEFIVARFTMCWEFYREHDVEFSHRQRKGLREIAARYVSISIANIG